MPLNVFYTMVQKSQKWPKTQIKGGPALSSGKYFFIAMASSMCNLRTSLLRTCFKMEKVTLAGFLHISLHSGLQELMVMILSILLVRAAVLAIV